MEDHQMLFLSTAPNMSDPRYVCALADLMGVNWRNVVLLSVYFLALAALALATLSWISKGFTDLKGPTAVGWGLVAALGLAALLPIWRLVEEELPRMRYAIPEEAYGALKPVRGTVTRHGLPVAMGTPFGSQRIHWQTDVPVMTGVTPYLPATIVNAAPVGSTVWIGLDPNEHRQPLFLGLAR